MDEAIDFTGNKKCLYNINEVRLITQTIYIFDVYNMDNKSINHDIYNAKANSQWYSDYHWLQLVSVTTKAIADWQWFFWFIDCKYKRKLGLWKIEGTWIWRCTPDKERLFLLRV